MFERAIAYHTEELRRWTHVWAADGNVVADSARAQAPDKIAEHSAILKTLLRPSATTGLKPAEALLRREMIHESQELRHLTRVLEGAALEPEERLRVEQRRDEAARRARAYEAGLLLLGEAGARPVRRHKKRGGLYAEYGRGTVQTDTPLHDNDPLVGYRDLETGSWYFRPPSEMDDGRFEDVDASAAAEGSRS